MERKTEKKGFINWIKTGVKKVKSKAKEFSEKHPIATKVIGGVVVAGTAVGVGVAAYNVAKAHDQNNNGIEPIEVPGIGIGSGNDNNAELVNIGTTEDEQKADWEQNKDNWSKVIGLAGDLNLDKSTNEGYHIYANDDGKTEVAHVVDWEYTYPPENATEENKETVEQEVEG